ncbi:MAG: hypothetical protein IH586_19315 [Anaerolineaceae bacterium]|nr:hypothetical protein [Anaerolineaceae bacterium]
MLIKHLQRMTALIFILVFLLLLALHVHPVRADVAPPPPPEGANILPNQPSTQVRMLAETVLIDVAATTGKQKPMAKVSATFTMRNLGSQEEKMEVRFPLNLLFPQYQSDLEECPYPEGGFPEISSLNAKVDGKLAKITTSYQRLKDPYGSRPEKNVACWANFAVTFPLQQDVIIEVTYNAEGYLAWNVPGLVEFPYVMVTGEGWAGTIGTAEITIRAPFELTDQTLMEYHPENGRIAGREISWHFEDEEPVSNIAATLVDPALWNRIAKENQNVEKNPQDGEAWGRLGKAYKETIMLSRGFRWDAGGPELFQLSREAYAKSVTLLPKDADWHYGYGELLWWNAIFPSFGSKREIRDDLVQAVDQFRLALKINPNHPKTREALDSLNGWGGDTSIVDLSGPSPVYVILTTTPTANAEPTLILTETALPSPSLTSTATHPAPTITATAAEVSVATAAATSGLTAGSPPTATPESKPAARGICGAGLLPAAGLVVIIGIRKLIEAGERI